MKTCYILASLIASLIAMNAYSADETKPPERNAPHQEDLIVGDVVPAPTPQEEANAKKIAEIVKADKARGFTASKKLNDIVGANTPEPVKREVYREIEKLEWTLRGVTDPEHAAAFRKGTLENIIRLVPNVPPEKLGKLLKLKKQDLREP